MGPSRLGSTARAKGESRYFAEDLISRLPVPRLSACNFCAQSRYSSVYAQHPQGFLFGELRYVSADGTEVAPQPREIYIKVRSEQCLKVSKETGAICAPKLQARRIPQSLPRWSTEFFKRSMSMRISLPGLHPKNIPPQASYKSRHCYLKKRPDA